MDLLGFDSLDALRTSLTERLGREMPDREQPVDLAPMVGRLLLDEARDNERRIGALRLLVSLVYLGLALASTFFGDVPVSAVTLLAISGWSIASALLYFALRRGWYRLWLRRAAPTADAIAIVVGADRKSVV